MTYIEDPANPRRIAPRAFIEYIGNALRDNGINAFNRELSYDEEHMCLVVKWLGATGWNTMRIHTREYKMHTLNLLRARIKLSL